jgi:hypothetical protein
LHIEANTEACYNRPCGGVIVEIIWIGIAAVLAGAAWLWFTGPSRQEPKADRTIRVARERLHEMATESAVIHDDLEVLKSALAERSDSHGFNIDLHGEAQRNADGQSRQEIIARLKEGEYVTLVPEPDNAHDSNAIRVDSGIGTIGYVSRHDAKRIGDLIARGAVSKCYIDEIRGGEDGYNYGVILRLETTTNGVAAHHSRKKPHDIPTIDRAIPSGWPAFAGHDTDG